MSAVTVRADGNRLHVSSPYDAGFISVVKALGGKWAPDTRTWAVPAKQRAGLREILLRCYGCDGGIPAPARPVPAPAAAPPAPSAPAPATPAHVIAAAIAALPQLERLVVPACQAGGA